MKRKLRTQTPKVLAQDHTDNETQKLDCKEFWETKKEVERNNIVANASYCPIIKKYLTHQI